MMNNYKISVSYDDYFANANRITSTQIEVVGDVIMFHTNGESIKFLDDNNVRYMLHSSAKKEVKKFLYNKTGIVIGLVVVSLLIVFNSFRISKISFNADYPINPLIEEYIDGQTQNLLFFSFHKNNYKELSKNLRSTFNQYEWINVDKKGSTIIVTIEPTTTKDMDYTDLASGDIVAKKDGVVDSYIIFNGTSTLQSSMYVKKGDILISGSASNVHAKGYVMAKTYESIVITVPKKTNKEELSGEVINYYELILFGKEFNLMKNKNYETSDLKREKSFNIPYIFTLNKIEEYEKDDIIYMYNRKTAIAYAKSVIENNFLSSKVLNDEKIERVEPLKVVETDNEFEITFLVKKLESIGVFIKHL